MSDDRGKKKKKFFPTFKKKSKGLEVLGEPAANEDNLTVALSHLSSNPPSPARTSDSLEEDPPLLTSTFDEDEEAETNSSSDMLLIFTSASNDTDDTPLQVPAGQPLSPQSSISDSGSFFRSLPPRKTVMSSSLTPAEDRNGDNDKPEPVPAPKQELKKKKPMPIDMDTNDEWHDDESHWVEFVDERRDHADWEWSPAAVIDWAPMDEVAELPFSSDNFEYLPKDTSDEASLDPSTVSSTVTTPPRTSSNRFRPMMVHATRSGDVEVCDPECPLRFFQGNEQEDDDEEPPLDTPGYPFLGDVDDEDDLQQQEDMFSCSFYQHKISKFQSAESRRHMTKRLHRETLALIGSVSEKLHTWDGQARSRFCTPQDEEIDEEEEEADVVSVSSAETRKKRNTSYFSTEAFSSDIFGRCHMIEPFLRFGQAEI